MAVSQKRDSIWRQDVIRRETAALWSELELYETRESPATALDFVRRQASRTRRKKDHLNQLRSFLCVVAAFRLAARTDGLDRGGADKLERLGQRLLDENKVQPGRSNLAYLHAQLHAARSAYEKRERRVWREIWRRQMARYTFGSKNRDFAQVEQAKQLLRLGDIPSMLALLSAIPEDSLPQMEEQKVHILLLQGLRLSGDVFSALDLNQELREKIPDQPELQPLLEFEEASCQLQLGAEPGTLLQSVKADPLLSAFEFRAQAILWALSVVTRAHVPKALAMAARRRKEDSAADLPAAHDLHLCLEILRECYNEKQALSVRLARVEEVMEAATRLGHVAEELLVLAAVARWLHRVRQADMAALACARYRGLGLSLSSGTTADPLGLITDILEGRYEIIPAAAYESKPHGSVTEHTIKKGWLSRSATMSCLSVEVAAAVGHERFRRLFRFDGKPKRLKQDESRLIVEIMTRHLHNLKGPLMKLGQTASYFGLNLPPQVERVFNDVQDRSTPMAGAEVRRLIEGALEQPMEQVFADFVDTPIGVGSIGQVHRARLIGGDEVAVKLRFPGMREIIENDIKTLRLLIPLIRLFTAQALPRAVFDELRRGLLAECDYRREGRLQERFREKYRNHPTIAVPRVHSRWTRDNVLVTDYVDATPLNEFCAMAPQHAKDETGKAIMEFVVGNCRDGFFNTDPHPGNFMIDEDRVWFLDYGSVKEWEPEEARGWADAIKAAVLNDYDLFRDALGRMKMVGDRRNFDFRHAFWTYLNGSMGKTVASGEERFDYGTLHREIRSIFTKENPNLSCAYLNPTYLYGFRVYFGLIAVLAKLGANADFHDRIRRIMLSG